MRVFIEAAHGVSDIFGANAYATAKTKSTPAAPTTVEAQYESTTKNVNVSWTGLTGAAAEALTGGYLVEWFLSDPSVQRTRDNDGEATVNDGTASSYTISGLPKGEYTIWVRALNDIGASAAGIAGGDGATVTVP